MFGVLISVTFGAGFEFEIDYTYIPTVVSCHA